MQYRIKVIEKYNGGKQFIPQFRDNVFLIKNLVGISLLPLLLIAIMMAPATGIDILSYFFMNWEEIGCDKIPCNSLVVGCILNNDTIVNCETQEDALEAIKAHKRILQEESIKQLEDKKTKKSVKTFKTTYIKI